MEDIVKMVADKSGIPQDKAQTAVNTVVGYLKEHLPSNLSSQVDQIMSGKEGGGMIGAAESFFNKK